MWRFGSFLLANAKQQQADVFITADVKYHDFFDAEDSLIIADIGHYESEQFTSELIQEILKENFPKFAAHLSVHNTNLSTICRTWQKKPQQKKNFL